MREVVEAAVGGRQHAGAGVAEREVHHVGDRAVGARFPVLATGDERRADQHLVVLAREDQLRVLGNVAGRAIDVRDDVLGGRRRCPEEFAGGAVKRVDHASLAGNAGQHLVHLALSQPRVDPGDVLRVGRHRGVDQQPLVRMVEVPVVVQMLVEPHDLPGVGVQREGRVVVEVRVVDAADHELRRG